VCDYRNLKELRRFDGKILVKLISLLVEPKQHDFVKDVGKEKGESQDHVEEG